MCMHMDNTDLTAVSAAAHSYHHKAIEAVKFLLTSWYLLVVLYLQQLLSSFGLLHL